MADFTGGGKSEPITRVYVTSVNDFPAASGGIITLDSTKEYFLNAELSIDDSIDVNGSLIFASKRSGSRMTYTPTTGSLFTGESGGELRNIELTAPNGTASVFNLDDTGATNVLNIRLCFIFSSNSVGSIEGYSGLRLDENFMLNNADGLTISNILNLVETTSNLVVSTSTVTHFTFVGAFLRIDMSRDKLNDGAASTSIDITGITSLTNGVIANSIFTGTGTPINGVNANGHMPIEWEAEGEGIETSKNSMSSGEIYIASGDALETTIATVDTPVKIAGTTTSNASALFRFDATNGRLTYGGRDPVELTVVVNASITAPSNNKRFAIFIGVNGTADQASRSNGKVGTGTDEIPISCHLKVLFDTDDYVEPLIEGRDDTTNFVATTCNMVI